jgi:tol-pal system protein YbgF
MLLLVVPGGGSDKEKEQLKLALDELKNEIVVLSRQIRSLQESMDRNSGQMSTLITQIGDNVSAIRQGQGRVADSASSTVREVSAIGERLSGTNQKVEQLSGQLEQLRKLVENLPKLPAFTEITPGNPDQLFAAAIGDYYRGNYDLAISEFRQYVETYPSSEMADNAQYWIGESLFAKEQYAEAATEFDKVVQTFPKGDKVPGARFKKGVALIKAGQAEAAKVEFQNIIKLFPRSNEAFLARQQLQQLGTQ